MLYETAFNALRSVWDSPFETDPAHPLRLDDNHYPYAYINQPSDEPSSCLMFIGHDGRVHYWIHGFLHDSWEYLGDAVPAYRETLTSWDIETWYLDCGPMLISNWIKKELL